MNIFEEIKRLCKIREITIDELMKKIGKSGINVYAGWKQRDCIPRADDLYQISKVLGVSVEHFFDDEEKVLSKSESILEKINSLSESELNTLNEMTVDQLRNLLNFANSMQR